MKKILLIFTILLSLNLYVLVNEKPINVLYVHDFNQVNLGGAEGFSAWMNRMHPDLKKNFEKSDFIQLHLLSDAYIKEEGHMQYWYSTNNYTKAVAKSYAEGYKYFYNK